MASDPMPPLRILSVVGARPNFMKIAPFARALGDFNARHPAQGGASRALFAHFLVHTGQHYDAKMSNSFFEDLNIPEPDMDLGIGSGTHAEQVGRTMIAFERVVREWRPDWVVVVGDVNATLACAVTAKQERVRLAHIESGLRSFDLIMPEEINRMVTDRLADLHFTTDATADGNLQHEGVPADRIRRVGNIMIDTLEANRDRAAKLETDPFIRRNALNAAARNAGTGAEIPMTDNTYAVLTLHRPATVDSPDVLAPLVQFLEAELSRDIPLVWSLHPRTRRQLEAFGLWDAVLACRRIALVQPLGYREMLRLNLGCRIMLTDSGGLQEECSVLGTPCITLRNNTERPVTLRSHGGVCELAGNDVSRVRAAFDAMRDEPRRPARPALWDGHTAERIVEAFAALAE